jgi:hypothetical protein
MFYAVVLKDLDTPIIIVAGNDGYCVIQTAGDIRDQLRVVFKDQEIYYSPYLKEKPKYMVPIVLC